MREMVNEMKCEPRVEEKCSPTTELECRFVLFNSPFLCNVHVGRRHIKILDSQICRVYNSLMSALDFINWPPSLQYQNEKMPKSQLDSLLLKIHHSRVPLVGWLTFFLSVHNTWNGGHLKNNNILLIRMVQENKCIDMEDTKCTTVYEEQCKSGTEKKCSTVYDTVTKRFFRA